jgi:hypothetical protein
MRGLFFLALALALAGCSTSRDTNPQRSATEQLLISTAADHAVQQLSLNLPKDTKVFVDPQYFEGTDQKYALGAIRERLLEGGARLVADRGVADVVVEPRAGALSIDEDTTLVGIPSFDIPIPLAGAFKFPEIALYKEDKRQGIAKFALTGYGAKDGVYEGSAGPVIGHAHKTKWVVLLFVSWSTDNLGRDRPEEPVHP